jgi:uncharacterized membrane protein
MSFVFDVASLFGGPVFVEAALFNLIAGVAAAVAAAVSGLCSYALNLRPVSTARRLARWHALLHGTSMALFIASIGARLSSRGSWATPRVPFVLSALGLALLGVGGYLGGMTAFESQRTPVTRRHRSPSAH